jgi:hypothetical protein
MTSKQGKGGFWGIIIVPIIILVLLCFGIYYLITIYQEEGTEKFIYSLVLVAALVIGLSHIILYLLRKRLENKNTPEDKRKKRRLVKYRNIVNYITPFVLIAMLYHFWQRSWVFAAVIVSILLLDRLNDLLRKNK